ncbi:helix-turn-helix domain-containing protein [Metabacillus fastidiosus]|uniref:helix-turn-helix domain-containing protein n=1 Tax=Metabacillus fastidiosus TaxID=1458 RepID=UPI003D28F700
MDKFRLSNRSWKDTPVSEKLTNVALDDKEFKATSNEGYVIAPQKIIRCLRISDLEKLLLLELLSLMGGANYAFPSHKYLAIRLGKKSPTSIKRALKTLQEKGFIYWAKGGGDLGTNHYHVKNLFYNPYLIMSEMTFYCIEKILEIYRGDIAYDDLYGAVLDFVEPKKGEEGIHKDRYDAYIKHLFQYPEDRDCPSLYTTYCDRLSDHIESKTGFGIDIMWESHFMELFESKLNDVIYLMDERYPDLYYFSYPLRRNDRIAEIEVKFGYPLDRIEYIEDHDDEEHEAWCINNHEFEEILRDADIYILSEGHKWTGGQKCLEKGKYITNRFFRLLSDRRL